MKPFTIIVQETEQQIVDTINKSNLPVYVLKNILSGINKQLNDIEQQEIEKYYNEQENKELDDSSFSNKKKGDKK